MKGLTPHTTSGIGFFLSMACAIHCMVMPVLLIFFPMLGDSVLHDPLLEWSVLGLLVVLGLYTMEHYRRKHHNSPVPMRIFALGAGLCLASLLLSTHLHEVLTVAGSLVIGLSHGVNLKLGRVAAA